MAQKLLKGSLCAIVENAGWADAEECPVAAVGLDVVGAG